MARPTREGKMSAKLMPNMSLDEQIRGVRRAVSTLSSRKSGPIWLLPSLRKRLRVLVAERKRRAERAAVR
jgi:hypothetical protein